MYHFLLSLFSLAFHIETVLILYDGVLEDNLYFNIFIHLSVAQLLLLQNNAALTFTEHVGADVRRSQTNIQ